MRKSHSFIHSFIHSFFYFCLLNVFQVPETAPVSRVRLLHSGTVPWRNILSRGRNRYVNKQSPGNGSPLRYSCLGNAMVSGAWQATVHGVAKSWTWPGDWAHTAKSDEYHFRGHRTDREEQSWCLHRDYPEKNVRLREVRLTRLEKWTRQKNNMCRCLETKEHSRFSALSWKYRAYLGAKLDIVWCWIMTQLFWVSRRVLDTVQEFQWPLQIARMIFFSVHTCALSPSSPPPCFSYQWSRSLFLNGPSNLKKWRTEARFFSGLFLPMIYSREAEANYY